MQTLFLVLHLIVSVILIFVVMAQEGKDPGMRGIQGASSDMGDSFFKKNGGTSDVPFVLFYKYFFKRTFRNIYNSVFVLIIFNVIIFHIHDFAFLFRITYRKQIYNIKIFIQL